MSSAFWKRTKARCCPSRLRNVEMQLPAKRAELTGKRLRETSDVAAWRNGCSASKPRIEPRGIWGYDETQKRSVWTEQTADTVGVRRIRHDRFVHRSDRRCRRRCTDAPVRSRWHSTRRPRLLRRRTREPTTRRSAARARTQPRYVSTAALVTNLSVHFKWGRESSRVWVTRLDDATPVADADIEITDYCNGALRWHGRTDHDGIASIDRVVRRPARQRLVRHTRAPLLVSARTDDDFSFALSSWNEGIRPYDFALQTSAVNGTADDVSQRARSTAVPRRRNGVDETLHAPSHRRGHRDA